MRVLEIQTAFELTRNQMSGFYETGPGSHITNVAGRMIQTVGRFSTDFYMLGREGRGGSDAAHMRPED